MPPSLQKCLSFEILAHLLKLPLHLLKFYLKYMLVVYSDLCHSPTTRWRCLGANFLQNDLREQSGIRDQHLYPFHSDLKVITTLLQRPCRGI